VLALGVRTYVDRAPSLTRMDRSPDELGRALAFMARVDEAVATEVRGWSLGTALITPELPKVWDSSYFTAEASGDGDGERVAEETARVASAAGLAHAAVVVTEGAVATALRPGLLAAGFEETRFVLMALRSVPPEPEIPVESASFADVAPSRRELTLETFNGDEALADQLRELDRRLEATIGGRWFAISDGGRIVSRAWLLAANGVGQVEDVATSASHRGRGLARAIVSAAARASDRSGNDPTFVVADSGETTPKLYRKTGFEPLGLKWRFLKPLGS
jgi:ribosomal protein S18 acetylase RimI-like enzyme